ADGATARAAASRGHSGGRAPAPTARATTVWPQDRVSQLDVAEVAAQGAVVARVLEQEGVVPAGRGDLEIGDDAPVVEQRAHDLARARRREAPVGIERNDEK